jgi:hypothetical protein
MGMDRATLHAPTPEAMLDLGHAICRDLHNGRNPNDMVAAIERSLPNLSQNQVQFLISAAAGNYCEDVLSSNPLPWVHA